MVKLDHVLINGDWEEGMPSCLLRALSSEISYHCPLLLCCEVAFKHNRQFQFRNHWVKFQDFEEVVTRAWLGTPALGDPLCRFAAKLATTVKAMGCWQASFCNNLKLKTAITAELIGRLDKAMDSRQLTTDERQFHAMLKMQRLGYATLDRAIWRQKSRVNNIKEGDAGTRFFKAKASSRRCRNHIIRLMVDGIIVTDQDSKVKSIHTHFDHIFGEKRLRPRCLNLAALGYRRIDLRELEEEITEEEVQRIIMELTGTGRPVLMGSPGSFISTHGQQLRGT
ncbi:uncharacterized protein [Aegilops tauschii subsp. strangulata]|uniref:uncharacterized protein n=1 Tax=Aegilops tauschii subsp. strangulata TaxID=200361 RepID=UPI003CC8A03F